LRYVGFGNHITLLQDEEASRLLTMIRKLATQRRVAKTVYVCQAKA